MRVEQKSSIDPVIIRLFNIITLLLISPVQASYLCYCYVFTLFIILLWRSGLACSSHELPGQNFCLKLWRESDARVGRSDPRRRVPTAHLCPRAARRAGNRHIECEQGILMGLREDGMRQRL